MKILNLVYPEKSDIKYKISKFPDGQQNITILPTPVDKPAIKLTDIITIKSRLNNFLDLELLICSVVSLKNQGIKEIHLYVPYFLGSRSDRKFEEGSNNYLKDVICPIINSLNFESVTVLDPHSDVLEACLNNFKKSSIGQFGLFKWSVGKIYNGVLPKIGGELKDIEGKYILISPDAGASKKIYKLVEQIGYKGDVITCSKYRDKEGKLSKVNVPINATYLNKDFIIIDDICDGGATFINIAKEIKLWDTTNSCKIYLIVTHGIFSKGFKELSTYFDGIYCTTSYQDLKKYPIEFGDVSSIRQIKFLNEKVKQLNVF